MLLPTMMKFFCSKQQTNRKKEMAYKHKLGEAEVQSCCWVVMQLFEFPLFHFCGGVYCWTNCIGSRVSLQQLGCKHNTRHLSKLLYLHAHCCFDQVILCVFRKCQSLQILFIISKLVFCYQMHSIPKSCFGTKIHKACKVTTRIVDVLPLLSGPYSSKCGNRFSPFNLSTFSHKKSNNILCQGSKLFNLDLLHIYYL